MPPIPIVAAAPYVQKLTGFLAEKDVRTTLDRLELPLLVVVDPAVVKADETDLQDRDAEHAACIHRTEGTYIMCRPPFFEGDHDEQVYILCHELRHCFLRTVPGYQWAHQTIDRLHFKWGIFLPPGPLSMLVEFLTCPLEADIERWLIGQLPRCGHQQLQTRLGNVQARLHKLKAVHQPGACQVFPPCVLRAAGPLHFFTRLGHSNTLTQADRQHCLAMAEQLAGFLHQWHPSECRRRKFTVPLTDYANGRTLNATLRAADQLLACL